MSVKQKNGPPGPTDPDAGIWQGRTVARRFVSPDGMVVLVGKTAEDNDIVSIKLGAPRDFWLHIASGAGSHVVVRNPDGLERMPKETAQFAAALAAYYSKARDGGKAAVHLTTCSEVEKPKGYPAGKVTIRRYKTVYGSPADLDLP